MAFVLWHIFQVDNFRFHAVWYLEQNKNRLNLKLKNKRFSLKIEGANIYYFYT